VQRTLVQVVTRTSDLEGIVAKYGDRLSEDEVVIHVAPGTSERVRIEELDVDQANAEIIVRVSKSRATGQVPLLGVMVK
jgi:hypothetical protein